MVQKAASLNPSLDQPVTGNSIKPEVNRHLFESGNDKAEKGEGWAQSFICCTHMAIRLWEIFTLHESAI